ncbi:MAG: hypothetical protein AB7U85_09445 [Alphaproteobacteria bacterium]
MGSLIRGLVALVTSGVLIRPAVIFGIALSLWPMFFTQNQDESYAIVKSYLPYLAMFYGGFLIALFSKKSRPYGNFSIKSLLANTVGNFCMSFLAFFIFIAFVSFISF